MYLTSVFSNLCHMSKFEANSTLWFGIPNNVLITSFCKNLCKYGPSDHFIPGIWQGIMQDSWLVFKIIQDTKIDHIYHNISILKSYLFTRDPLKSMELNEHRMVQWIVNGRTYYTGGQRLVIFLTVFEEMEGDKISSERHRRDQNVGIEHCRRAEGCSR